MTEKTMFFVRGLGFLLVDTNGEEVLVGPRGLGIPFNSERDEWLLGTSAEIVEADFHYRWYAGEWVSYFDESGLSSDNPERVISRIEEAMTADYAAEAHFAEA